MTILKATQRVSRGMIETAARLLGPLRDDVVFLGGIALALLITDPAAPDMRPTEDVDVIMAITSRIKYYKLGDQLRELGFKDDPYVLCRWHQNNLVIDIMPTQENILTFGNRWYAPAMKSAQEVSLTDDLRIFLISAPYFLATKLEAFQSRGNGDFCGSHDMEDVVSLLDGRAEIVVEVQDSDEHVKGFLAETFQGLRQDEEFTDALAGLVLPDAASQARIPLILSRMEQIGNALRQPSH